MFSLFNFSSIFRGGQLTPFAPMCGRLCILLVPNEDSVFFLFYPHGCAVGSYQFLLVALWWGR